MADDDEEIAAGMAAVDLVQEEADSEEAGGGGKRGKRGGKGKRHAAHGHGTLASQADPLALYEEAVQSCANEIRYLEKFYREAEPALRLAPKPRVLREDFCGTAQLSAAWIQRDVLRAAIAIDIDADVVAWARERHATGAHSDRLELITADVLAVTGLPSADILCAFNFSVNYLHDRATLLVYLRQSWQALRTGGVLVLDTFGGPASLVPFKRKRPVGSVRYTFEQVSYDPATARSQCRIHFRFADGSVLRNSFSYDWRRWSLPELVDALVDAGFATPQIWIAESDTTSGSFFDAYKPYADLDIPASSMESWNAYVVARRT